MSHQRGKRNTNPNTSLLQIEGVADTNAAKYVLNPPRTTNEGTKDEEEENLFFYPQSSTNSNVIFSIHPQILPRQASRFRLPRQQGTTRQQDPSHLGQSHTAARKLRRRPSTFRPQPSSQELRCQRQNFLVPQFDMI